MLGAKEGLQAESAEHIMKIRTASHADVLADVKDLAASGVQE